MRGKSMSVILENNQGLWKHNHTSGLYFLSTENDPREDCQGSLAAGKFDRFMFTQMRNGVPFKPGLNRGVYLSYSHFQDEWTTSETVIFDPSSKVYQIDNLQWKHTDKGMRFQDLDDTVAAHLLYHQEKCYSVPGLSKDHLDPLFEILRGLQKAKTNRNRGMWWLQD